MTSCSLSQTATCRHYSISTLVKRALGILTGERLYSYSHKLLVVIQRRVIGGQSGVWCEVQTNANNFTINTIRRVTNYRESYADEIVIIKQLLYQNNPKNKWGTCI